MLAQREGLAIEGPVQSDTAALHTLVSGILAATRRVRCLRDPTRGGVAAALNEIAAASSVKIEIYEESLPVRSEVRWACDMLGLDPLVIANEGKVIMICVEADVEAATEVMRSTTYGKDARIIGRVIDRTSSASTTSKTDSTSVFASPTDTGRVILRTEIGGSRIVEMPYGEELPRIC